MQFQVAETRRSIGMPKYEANSASFDNLSTNLGKDQRIRGQVQSSTDDCLVIGTSKPKLSQTRVYSAPKLTVYGSVHQMTAAGTGGPAESDLGSARSTASGSRL